MEAQTVRNAVDNGVQTYYEDFEPWVIYTTLRFFAVGQFVVQKKKNLNEPNLTNLLWPNLTESNFFFDGEVFHGEKSAQEFMHPHMCIRIIFC